MRKLFVVDVKRLLNNKIAIIIVVGAPLLLVLLISFAVAPYFYANIRTDNFYVAVYNEDNNPLTVSILQGLIESESLGGLIEVRFVDSSQDGMNEVENGAAAFIHVPKGMQDDLYSGKSVVIRYYGNPDMPLEDALLYETLHSGTELVSHAQHAVNTLYDDSIMAGVDSERALELYGNTTRVFFLRVLARANLYEKTEETSPLDGALPVEYYAASLLVLFVALGAMPIARITADDACNGLIHRQLLSGNPAIACFISRWLAGSLFLFVQYAVLSAGLCIITGSVSYFSGNVLTIFIAGILLSMFVSLVMILVGLYSRTSLVAVGVSFMASLSLALAGGLLVPSAFMPMLIRDVSFFTPFSAALRLGISGMFDGSVAGAWMFILILLVYIMILLPVCIRRFQRRTI